MRLTRKTGKVKGSFTIRTFRTTEIEVIWTTRSGYLITYSQAEGTLPMSQCQSLSSLPLLPPLRLFSFLGHTFRQNTVTQ